MVTDEMLGQKMQDGDEAAVEALVSRHHRAIFAYLYRLTGDRPTAEDLTQETFARLLTRIDSYSFPRPFKPWLYTIAHNLFRDHCKKADNRLACPDAIPDHPPSAEPPSLLDRIVQRSEVLTALHELAPPFREVLILRYYHDLKVDDIAAILAIPSGTVKYRLSTAFERLRNQLVDESMREEGVRE